jgi:hypothetical protein
MVLAPNLTRTITIEEELVHSKQLFIAGTFRKETMSERIN